MKAANDECQSLHRPYGINLHEAVLHPSTVIQGQEAHVQHRVIETYMGTEGEEEGIHNHLVYHCEGTRM